MHAPRSKSLIQKELVYLDGGQAAGQESFSGRELSGSPDDQVGANPRRPLLVLVHVLVYVVETVGVAGS